MGALRAGAEAELPAQAAGPQGSGLAEACLRLGLPCFSFQIVVTYDTVRRSSAALLVGVRLGTSHTSIVWCDRRHHLHLDLVTGSDRTLYQVAPEYSPSLWSDSTGTPCEWSHTGPVLLHLARSLSTTSWRSSHAVSGVRTPFLFKAERYSAAWMDHALCIRSSEGGRTIFKRKCAPPQTRVEGAAVATVAVVAGLTCACPALRRCPKPCRARGAVTGSGWARFPSPGLSCWGGVGAALAPPAYRPCARPG